MKKLSTWDDWKDYFVEWQDSIGLERSLFDEFKLEPKFDELPTDEIEFGDYAGLKKWESVMEIPDQRIRDGLMNLIVYQGDTEFASVEQQRKLFKAAPSEYDLYALSRIMAEEMRHGWQMCYLLMNYFGETGKVEARKQLERRSWDHNRLLGSFNQDVDNWLDFYTYTQFVDRDGKFQLKMLSKAAFAPLARSMGPMLKEESFHLGTGNNGLLRIAKQGRIPVEYMQKWFNKWLPTAYDLFGKDESSTANWAYVWGLKSRFDEGDTTEAVDKDHLNERSRQQYFDEISALVDRLNKILPEGSEKLYAPDMKFNRGIGNFADQHWTVDGSRRLNEEEWNAYKDTVLPTADDKTAVLDILKGDDWIDKRPRPERAAAV